MKQTKLIFPGELSEEEKNKRVGVVVIALIILLLVSMSVVSSKMIFGIRQAAAENIGRTLMTPGK